MHEKIERELAAFCSSGCKKCENCRTAHLSLSQCFDNMILLRWECYHEDKLLLWVRDKEARRDALNQKLVQRCYQLSYEDEAGGLDPENGFYLVWIICITGLTLKCHYTQPDTDHYLGGVAGVSVFKKTLYYRGAEISEHRVGIPGKMHPRHSGNVCN